MGLRVACKSCGNEAIASGDVSPGTYLESFYVDACENCDDHHETEENNE